MRRLSFFVLILLIVNLVFAFSIHSVSANPTDIFESGFENETNNFNVEWTGYTVTTGETATVITTDPHHGLRHAQFTCDGSSTSEKSYAYKTFGSAYALLYSRGYIMVKDNLPASNQGFRVIEHWDSTNALWITAVRIYNDQTVAPLGLCWLLYYHSGTSHLHVKSTTPSIALDTWYCIEVFSEISGTIGKARLYIDGSLVLEVTNLDNDAHGNIQNLLIGEILSSGQTAHKIYVDCVKVADAYIGLETQTKNFYGSINQTLSVTMQKAVSFSLHPTINEAFTVLGSLISTIPILKISGAINTVIEIATKARTMMPYVAVSKMWAVWFLFGGGGFVIFFFFALLLKRKMDEVEEEKARQREYFENYYYEEEEEED